MLFHFSTSSSKNRISFERTMNYTSIINKRIVDLINQILSERGYRMQPRGLVKVKGKGEMQTYLVIGKEMGSPKGVHRQPSNRSSLAAVVYGMVRARRRQTTAKQGKFKWRPSTRHVRVIESNINLPAITTFRSPYVSSSGAAVTQDFDSASSCYVIVERVRCTRSSWSFKSFLQCASTTNYARCNQFFWNESDER